MEERDKELLLKDLCARLPYGVICRFTDTFDGCEVDNVLHPDDITDMFRHRSHCDSRIDVKPYLRPMSSMTEEEREEYEKTLEIEYQDMLPEPIYHKTLDSYYYLLEHHFDFLGLIPAGCAIEVTEENNPYKDYKYESI